MKVPMTSHVADVFVLIVLIYFIVADVIQTVILQRDWTKSNQNAYRGIFPRVIKFNFIHLFHWSLVSCCMPSSMNPISFSAKISQLTSSKRSLWSRWEWVILKILLCFFNSLSVFEVNVQYSHLCVFCAKLCILLMWVFNPPVSNVTRRTKRQQ